MSPHGRYIVDAVNAAALAATKLARARRDAVPRWVDDRDRIPEAGPPRTAARGVRGSHRAEPQRRPAMAEPTGRRDPARSAGITDADLR